MQPPRNQVTGPQIETILSRSVAGFAVVFFGRAVPQILSQLHTGNVVVVGTGVLVVFAGVLAVVAASLLRRKVRAANGYLAGAYILTLATWPLADVDPAPTAGDRPWLWLLCTVATAAAVISFSEAFAAVYVVLAPVVFGVVRLTSFGGGASPAKAALDVLYVLILGGGVLILVTLLRRAAVTVDAAQSTALERYSHAVHQHATEIERMQVDAIVHDSVLTTLLSAARAFSPEARDLSTRMARNAMRQLTEAVTAIPAGDAMVTIAELYRRVTSTTLSIASPFVLRGDPPVTGSLTIHAAEAVYSATVQAMVNSLQHAGTSPSITRWISFNRSPRAGVRIGIGDTGTGFSLDRVPAERIGLRVSIIERVVRAGGSVDIESSAGAGTTIWITWPAHADVSTHIPTIPTTGEGRLR